MQVSDEVLCLRNYLSSFANSSILWVSGDTQLSVGDTIRIFYKLQEWANHFYGRRIAIDSSDMLNTALLMVMLDGLCDAILMVPPGLSKDIIHDYLQRSNIDVLITDNKSTTPQIDQVYFDLKHLSNVSKQTLDLPLKNITHRKTEWIIPTSGTTGIPKLVCHTLKSLTRTVKQDTKYSSNVWGLLYSLTRFAGLQVFFQSFVNESQLIFTDRFESFEDKVEVLVSCRCNALSATPTMWRKILMSSAGKNLPLRQITLGGETSDANVLKALALAFPSARIVHIYASTEAGVGFAVHDGLEGFPKDYLNNPPKDIGINVDKKGYLLIRTLENEQYFLNEETPLCNDDGWINTGDIVRLENDRYIFLGRASGVINVGGDKVYSEEIEHVINQVPGVALVAVTGRKSSIMGALVEATIVTDNSVVDKETFLSNVKQYCRAHLPAYKVPAILKITESLEMSPSGKIIRK